MPTEAQTQMKGQIYGVHLSQKSELDWVFQMTLDRTNYLHLKHYRKKR